MGSHHGRTIYQQPSPDEVHAQLDRVTDQLQNRFPQVASLLDEAGPDVLAFSSFPLAHWKKIWSNNPQERLNKEIRRRTDVVAIFPNPPAVRRLVGAVLAEQHDEWAVGRRYITPVALTFNEALPVEGVSTRRVDDLVKALGCEGISKSQVSRICQELDVVVDGFMGRPLDAGPYPYLWLDALTQKVREAGRIVNVSVVVARAVNGEGKREIIGMDVGTSEDGAFWLAFLRSLSARGLSGVELVVSDAHQGLRGAIAAVFGGASWQRCRTHFMTNLLTRVPRRAQPWVATMVAPSTSNPPPMRYTPSSTG